ncbi:S1 family peptidase [Streptomyces sp. WMMC500]|uniref:S1 family peptidase n=1 Tax=Streptomyces sp. WMMC500 TaxID=3015154 RepID=UPI00248AA403|nr:S1 family peptidase [Streptomyces sp. WMMC500]WBB60828.1 S1 family peptidase [Streptomyces sp. WMMC500]
MARGRGRWRTTLALSAGVAAVGGTLYLTPAGAAVWNDGSGTAGADTAAGPAAGRTGAVRAFQESFPGVGDEEAWRRIQAEDGRVDLITGLAKDDAETFGGSWYDGATDTQHLQATTAEAADRFAGLAADRGIKAEVHQVEYSYARLTAEAEQARAGAHPVLGDAAEGDAAVDVEANRVVAGLASADLKSARNDTMAVPDTFRVKPRSTTDPSGLPIVDDLCDSRAHCSKPLRGGIAVTSPSNGCSLGFTAYANDHPKRKFAITAGHCGKKDERLKHSNWTIGDLDRVVFDNDSGTDVARARVENTHWLSSDLGWHYNPDDHDDPLPVTGRLTSESGIQNGQTVCLSARFNPENGNDCGTIDGVVGNGYIRVVGHDACPGDSGGGWYRPSGNGRVAYGIHKGGAESCHGDQGGNYDYFTSLPRTEDRLDVTVHTR